MTETNGTGDGGQPDRRLAARDHFRITGAALKRWLIAQTQDAAAVAVLWLAGLLIIGVPWAPLWAVIGFFCQYVPNIGAVFALLGPASAGLVSGGFIRLAYVLILYAVIVVVDGLVLQPYLLKRTARVPIWASILTPLVFGLLLGFWGVLLAAPLLAVIYTYRTLRPPPSPGA